MIKESLNLHEFFQNREDMVLTNGIVLAGNIVLKRWRQGIEAKAKGTHHEIVTEVDIDTENFLKNFIAQNLPKYDVLTEETPEKVGSAFIVVDPLDGSSFFQRGLPDWSVSAAKIIDGEIRSAVTYCPTQQELFTAQSGRGAFLNGKRIHVSEVNDPKEMVVNVGQRVTRTEPEGRIQTLYKTFRTAWTTGSTALVLGNLAVGRIDASIQKDQSFWDFAAGRLLIKEAGGDLTLWNGSTNFDMTGARTNSFIATNGVSHKLFERLVA